LTHRVRVAKPSQTKANNDDERTKQFDLTEDYWLQHPKEFWEEFEHTGQIIVPKEFEKWLIGQERMKEEFFLNLEEWVRKLKDIQEMRRKGQDDKDIMRRFLKERPGPYLLYVGQPGTGKSLLIKIANQKLKELYKKHGIELQDTLLIKNPINKQRPLVRYVPAGMGKRIKIVAEYIASRQSLKTSIMRGVLGFIILIGMLMLSTGFFLLAFFFSTTDPEIAWFFASGIWMQWLMIGMFMTVFPLMILGLSAGGGMFQGIAKRGELDEVPALVVDNSSEPELYVDMTQGNTSAMFGSIQHDPWQSGGMGTPTHHRMQAGKIHEADFKILYADEFKNFLRSESLVIEFLTPLEDGTYPIRGRGWAGSEGNASLAGETDIPVDCCFFLIAACNYDAMPLLNNYPALRNRFSYGNIVRSDDEIDATEQNEIKIAQFLADEAYRFRTPPLCREAVKVVIGHARRKGSSSERMRLQMRPYIQDLKKAAQLVWARPKRKITCECGIYARSLIHAEDMLLAIDDYAKPIEQQVLDDIVSKRKPYRILRIKGTAIGMVNGLVVLGESDEGRTGDVANVTAWLKKVDEKEKAAFIITGAPMQDQDTWMQNSIRTVRTTIYRLYGIDLAKEYYVHVSFLQTDAKGIDGPSAGITMTLAIMSCLGDPRIAKDERKPIPIRQDIAVTGTVENLGEEGDVRVGPIGGTFEKVYGAQKWGLKKVIVPHENYDHQYFGRLDGKKIKVIGAETVLQFFDIIRGDT